MTIMDSIGGYISVAEKPLRELLDALTENELIDDLVYCSIVEEDVPRQENAIDCGVLLCRFAYAIVNNELHPYKFETSSKKIRSWLTTTFFQSLTSLNSVSKCNIDQSQLKILISEVKPSGIVVDGSDISLQENPSGIDNFSKSLTLEDEVSSGDKLDTLLERESLEVIQRDRLLTPDFINSCDYPEDIFSLPYGYQTFINNFPKLERPERPSVIFDRAFIREKVKKFEVNSRYLYEKPETSPFYKDKEFVNKNDIGGTNFWPIEYFDMALEITYYLQGLECDIVKASLPILGTTMKRVVIPEILRYLIAERFNISPKDAFQIIKKQSL